VVALGSLHGRWAEGCDTRNSLDLAAAAGVRRYEACFSTVLLLLLGNVSLIIID